MNINELEELANIWVFCEDEEDGVYAKSFLELIAAYREAVAALASSRQSINAWPQCRDKELVSVDSALATAKRLGVE